MDGLEYLKERSIPTAERYFEQAYSLADVNDPNRYKYQSFYGFSRVLNGHADGLMLCKNAVKGNPKDGDIYLNLARAELFNGDRAAAVKTLDQGLLVDRFHQGLQELKNEIGCRNYNPIPILKRSNPLNEAIGRLIRKPSIH
ncbi:MAG: tetratricopeptide repeat protein [Gammaproteobacteria bacterium]|nr:tetratricopeptide repeat protein [Gammaproteobacteria bacterium]